MIILQRLEWSNAFSYGPDNYINFSESQLTQLVGKNGHGKSSIALILEEVLFNKNSKGVKKGDILNRNLKAASYTISLTFQVDSDNYKIVTKRGSSQTVVLTKNNEDISEHTATATYKLIESIIGMDHKTFSQIVYQSSANSLEFLYAPDTARKKFLIELLNLSSYTDRGEKFKTLLKSAEQSLAKVNGSLATLNSIKSKYSNMRLEAKELKEVPNIPETISDEISDLKAKRINITSYNKKITDNLTYKKLQSKITLVPVPEKPNVNITEKTNEASVAKSKIRAAMDFKKKISSLHGACPTCLQQVDSEMLARIVKEQQDIITRESLVLNDADAAIKEAEVKLKEWTTATNATLEWEKYHSLIDPKLPEATLDDKDLVTAIAELTDKLEAAKQEAAKITKWNNDVIYHNASVELAAKELKECSEKLDAVNKELAEISNKASKLAVLVKAFSTTGLVAYKLENLVKDLEFLSNEYLGELSGGRFQIAYQITGSDKLNVVITDNGSDIDIQSLSGGERARVNVASLLAIRGLMQSLSKSRLNLLILDETVEQLDVDGKEKLIEVLLNEGSLNTVLVSHGFTHPLLEKVHVIKQSNISRIER